VSGTLDVNFGIFSVQVRLKDQAEIGRAHRALRLISGTQAIPLQSSAGRDIWDSLTPERRAQYEADADWLNDKITEAKLKQWQGSRLQSTTSTSRK